MCKGKHTKLGHTAFIVGGDNEPRKTKVIKTKVRKLGHATFIAGEKTKTGAPEFVRDEYEQGVAKKNKGASSTSLIYTHGRK
jgi:hypothetical protein